MNESRPSTTWVDPDDAPEVTAADLARAKFHVGGKEVSRREFARSLAENPRRGRPPVAEPRPTLNMRIDADVLAALRATGRGWQTRVNALLREAVEKGRVK
jgi:uncharacterized protein (DUF4415 family)